jgi:hypothetical protein
VAPALLPALPAFAPLRFCCHPEQSEGSAFSFRALTAAKVAANNRHALFWKRLAFAPRCTFAELSSRAKRGICIFLSRADGSKRPTKPHRQEPVPLTTHQHDPAPR